MAILAGSGANADVAEESVMHPIIEAGIMKTRIRPRRTAGRTGLVWRGLPDRAAGCCGRCAFRGCCLVFGPGRPRTGRRSEVCLARRAGPDPRQGLSAVHGAAGRGTGSS
jgi:hypothetical protein